MSGAHKQRVGFDDLEKTNDVLRAVSTLEPLPVSTPLGELDGLRRCLNEILDELRAMNEQLNNME